jgi:hypothetical protein
MGHYIISHETNLLRELLVKKDKIISELENENADLRVYKRLWKSLESNGNSYKD